MVAKVLNYTFIPNTRTVTLKDVQTVELSRVQYIINTTRNVVLYDYSDPSYSLTLDLPNAVIVSPSCAGMLYTDTLDITYDYQLYNASTSGGGGNTGSLSAGTASLSLGQAVFSNSNGVSFGISGQTITASVNPAAGGLINFSAGSTSNDLSNVRFQNSNGISFGLNGSTITASHNALTSQSNQAVSAANGSFTFQTLSIANSNGISFSTGTQGVYATVKTDYQSSGAYLTTAMQSDAGSQFVNTSAGLNLTNVSATLGSNSISISVAAQSAQPVAASASNGSFNFSTLNFVETNGVTWATSTDGIRASVETNYQPPGAYLTTAMASNRGSDFVQATAVFAGTNATGTIASNGISVSVNAQSSVPQNASLYALGNTTQNSSTVLSLNALSFNGIGAATVGYSNGSIQVSVPTQTVDTNKAGTGFTSAGNNIGMSGTLGTDGLSLSATVAAQSNQNISLYGLGNTTQNSSTVLNASNLSFNAIGSLTVGYSNGSIQLSAANALTSQSNQIASADNGSFSFQTLSFSNANGISFGTSAGSAITASHDGLTSQSNQNISLYALGNTTQNSSTLLNASNLSFNGLGNATVGFSNGSIQISVTGGGGGAAISAGANSQNTGTVNFSNSNGVSFGLSNDGVMTASHNGLTSQSNQAFSAQGGSSAFQTLTFNNANGATFSNNAGAVELSYTVPSTAGLLSNIRISAGTTSNLLSAFTFDNGNGITFGLNASTLTASHNGLTTARASTDAIGLNTAQSNVTWTVNSSGLSLDGRGYAGTGTTFNGANMSGSITQNSNGLQLSLSVAAPGAAAENNWINLLGANTAGNTTASGSTIGWSGQGVTLSGTNGSQVVISAPATSSISGTGQVSISVNGSTISIGVPAAVTYSRYNEFKESPMVVGAIGQASLHLQPWLIPNLHMDRVVLHNQFSNATNSSGSFTLSQWVGLYTQNVSTLSLLASTSMSTNFTGSGTAGSYSLYGGIRGITIGWTNTLTEGMYWVGVIHRSTSGGANQTVSQLLNSNINSTYSGILGAASNATKQWSLGLGVYTASTTAMPASVGFTQINGNSSIFLRPPSLYFVSGTV